MASITQTARSMPTMMTLEKRLRFTTMPLTFLAIPDLGRRVSEEAASIQACVSVRPSLAANHCKKRYRSSEDFTVSAPRVKLLDLCALDLALHWKRRCV